MAKTSSGLGAATMKKLFIIHGWTYSLDKWVEVTQLLKKKGIDPILLRVPGLTEPSEEVWDIDGYVQWLRGQIGNEKAPIVLGHSNGGRISMAYNQAYPNHIAKLILLDSAGIPKQQRRSKVKLAVLKVLSKIGKIFSYIPSVRNVFYKLIGAQDYLEAPPNMKKTMRNMLDADSSLDPSQSQMPTTIIWGREDTITPLTDGELLHQKITGSALNVIDGARHAPQFTHAQQVADVIAKVVEG
jgi:pimeloyl-ACP methyl ester carboxylesterase